MLLTSQNTYIFRWENSQLFSKAKHESRDELWLLLSSWNTLVTSLSSISTKHQLFHYLKVLPKKHNTIDFIGMIQVNFVSHFHLPNNFFHLKNLFCGSASKAMFHYKNASLIGSGLVMLAKFVSEIKTHFGKDVLSKLLESNQRVAKTDIGWPLCMNSNAMYCSSCEKCEEEMSLLERGILVMLGIPSFNAAASINFEKRFYDSKKGLGEEIVIDLADAVRMVAEIARSELLGCARLLRSFRHRVILPPLRLGKGIGRAQVELQLLGQLGFLTNTVMLDGPSTVIKQVVQKLRFKLLSIKAICKLMLGHKQLKKEVRMSVKTVTLKLTNEGLGN